MCRNIKQLRRPETPPTAEECEAAARQFVRKVTGYNKPSKANEEQFETAVTHIATITQTLFENLTFRS
jgi:hypothetical protein